MSTVRAKQILCKTLCETLEISGTVVNDNDIHLRFKRGTETHASSRNNTRSQTLALSVKYL